MLIPLFNPDGELIKDPHYEALLKGCFKLAAELDCRIQHGVDNRHLVYARDQLQSLCYPPKVIKEKPNANHDA